MKDCPLCQLEKSETPYIKIHEENEIVAYLHPYPVNIGQLLIFPKEHVHSLSSLSPETHAALFALCTKLSRAVLKTNHYDGYNLIHHHADCAGQAFPHSYIELIPRIGTDGFSLKKRQNEESTEDLKDMAKQIMAKIRDKIIE